ncbi:MAG: hypothetical protein LQ344_004856 [Seirophora lacunosa]|nr:MAG: hypothetical protein LQ344_004856 [Seirophora lacunosa]
MPSSSNHARARPSVRSRGIEHDAANRILAVSESDALLHQTFGDPTPLGYNREERYQLALSYIYKVKGRLNKTHYTRLIKTLHEHGKGGEYTLEKTREEISRLYEVANEYELWEEFLEAFMPHWLHETKKREEKEMTLAEGKRRRNAISKPASSTSRLI